MRWRTIATTVVLGLTCVAGCKKQYFITEQDYDRFSTVRALPPNFETRPISSLLPTEPRNIPAPSHVDHPDLPPRPLSLAEAISIGLENGRAGSSSAVNGQANDRIQGGSGSLFQGDSDSIRVLAMDPAMVGSDIERALAKFDAHYVSSLSWTNTDQPISTAFDALQSGNNNQLRSRETLDANLTMGLVKPLPTGGSVGITGSTDYQLSNFPNPVNPFYRPSLQFAFEQPLLQGFGIDVNQLRAAHPGASLIRNLSVSQQANAQVAGSGSGSSSILIARMNFDVQRAEFERRVHEMVTNIEQAYWNLYGAYGNLWSREQGLRMAYEVWKINKAKFDAGRIGIPDFEQIRGQYEQFRGQRLTALGQVLEAERQLRMLLGLAVSDGTRLVPIDCPTLAPYLPDWQCAVNETMSLRPELVQAREGVKARQLAMINVKNATLPNLTLGGTYDTNAIGSRLDGPDGSNALRNLASNHHNNWSVLLRYDWILGRRDANAQLRRARLDLARSYMVLDDWEKRAVDFLAFQYRQIVEAHRLIGIQKATREAYGNQLKARLQDLLAGRGTLDTLLEAQRFWADALANEYSAIVRYNNALVLFEYAKGTVLQHDNIMIAEGPLPNCVMQRATEHQRERSAALVLRERAKPVAEKTLVTGAGQPTITIPDLPQHQGVSIPSMFAGKEQQGLSSTPNYTLPATPTAPLSVPEPLPQPKRLDPPTETFAPETPRFSEPRVPMFTQPK